MINSRIGHISEDFFLYMCKKNEEKNTKKIIFDLFAIDETEHRANIELKKLISNEVIVLPLLFIKHFYFFLKIVSKKLPFLKRLLAYERKSKKDGYQYFSDQMSFKFPYETIEIHAQNFFKKKKLDINKKFVCLNLWSSIHIKDINHDHHSHRKISIKPFIKLIEYLDSRDYYIF